MLLDIIGKGGEAANATKVNKNVARILESVQRRQLAGHSTADKLSRGS